MNSTQNKPIGFDSNALAFIALWLKVNLLKLLSLGLYAPWGNDVVRQYLLNHFQFKSHAVHCQSSAKTILKLRLAFLLFASCLLIIDNYISGFSWLLWLLLVSVLPALFMLEKSLPLKACLINDEPLIQKVSITELYREISFPLMSFIIFSIFIFNSAIIDSRFLASIDDKEEAPIFAEDSYLAKAEKSLNHDLTTAGEHHDHHQGKDEKHKHVENWGETISAEEIAYLEEHEKSHNHGSIALSRLQKYQIANQGNQFIQYALVLFIFLIIFPWLDYKMLSYRIRKTSYRNHHWQLKQGLESFYYLYLKVMLVVVSLISVSAIVISQLLMGSEGSSPEFWSNALVNGLWLIPLLVFLFLFTFLLLSNWRQQWVLENLDSFPMSMKFSHHYFSGIVLSISKALILMISLGLALPYCQILEYRLLSRHLVLEHEGN